MGHATEISRYVWQTKYRCANERGVVDSWRRFARALAEEGTAQEFMLTDYALELWQPAKGAVQPAGFITAVELPLTAHLAVQAALQPFMDNAILTIINVPESCPFDEFKRIYDLAYERGLKGCTAFRPNPVTGGTEQRRHRRGGAALLRLRARGGLNA